MFYNVKIYTFPTGEQQIRVYDRPMRSKGAEKGDSSGVLDVDFDDTVSDQERAAIVSMNRSKNKIYELARSNEWEWFFTFTFDQKKVPSRYDYDDLASRVSQWLKNFKKRKAPDLKYMIVPEMHKDGAWHFHAVMSSVGAMKFLEFKPDSKTGDMIYNVLDYKLGYSSASKIKDTNKTSNYITKYITKELTILTSGRKRYWRSQNLNEPSIDHYNLTETELSILIPDNEKTLFKPKRVEINAPDYVNAVTYYEIKNEN